MGGQEVTLRLMSWNTLLHLPLAIATDFGDLTAVKKQVMATSDGTRGLIAGGVGASSANLDVIEYITIANTGNATDFGDLSSATIKMGFCF